MQATLGNFTISRLEHSQCPVWIVHNFPSKSLSTSRLGYTFLVDTKEKYDVEYLPRVIDWALAQALEYAGGVVIEGPRGCGKTMTGLNTAASAVFLDDPRKQNLVQLSPERLLDGPRPRLLDEWQQAPGLWNLARHQVDFSTDPGLFIFTGSSVPADDQTRHTGAARFVRLRQSTMSWFERPDLPQAKGDGVSLSSLFNGELPSDGPYGVDYEQTVEALARSGFPALTKLTVPNAMSLTTGYLEELVRSDVPRLASVAAGPEGWFALFRSLARFTAAEATFTTITKDLQAHIPGITDDTVSTYLGILQRLYCLEPLTAWSVKLRSKATLRRSPKWHFTDPALAIAAMRTKLSQLLDDPETVGLLFESAVLHDLRVYAANLGGNVYHYRDSNKYEIDLIVTDRYGAWGAIEVKLGAAQISPAADSLARACNQIDSSPAFRLVVTALGPTATLPDGTITCPLNALRP